MHFANDPDYHWTLYSDNRGNAPPSTMSNALWMMPAVRGNKAPGYCFPYPGDEYNCEELRPDGPASAMFVVGSRGRRLFRCIVFNGTVFSDDINVQKLQTDGMYYPYPDDGKKKKGGS